MIFQFLFLLYFGLCLSQRGYTGDAPLPKPNFSAWPSSVVPPKSNVTLRCWTPTRDVEFVLMKGRIILNSLQLPNSAGSQAEVHLSDLQKSDVGEYSCEYYRTQYQKSAPVTSQSTSVLLLLVTGDFPKPSLQGYSAHNTTAGKTVTLQCQKPGNAVGNVMFALLKEGTPAPLQHQRPFRDTVRFSLNSVTVKDTGNYSCVYYQPTSPFWTSHPSDSLEIWVTGTTSEDYRKGNFIRLGLAALILMIIGAFLIEALYSQKKSPCGSRSRGLPGQTMSVG